MDMRSYIMQCLERHLSDFDLDGVELTEEDVDAVERQIMENGLTLNNLVMTLTHFFSKIGTTQEIIAPSTSKRLSL